MKCSLLRKKPSFASYRSERKPCGADTESVASPLQDFPACTVAATVYSVGDAELQSWGVATCSSVSAVAEAPAAMVSGALGAEATAEPSGPAAENTGSLQRAQVRRTQKQHAVRGEGGGGARQKR